MKKMYLVMLQICSYNECSSTDQEHWDDDDIATSSDGDSSSDSALIRVVLLFLFLWSSFQPWL